MSGFGRHKEPIFEGDSIKMGQKFCSYTMLRRNLHVSYSQDEQVLQGLKRLIRNESDSIHSHFAVEIIESVF